MVWFESPAGFRLSGDDCKQQLGPDVLMKLRLKRLFILIALAAAVLAASVSLSGCTGLNYMPGVSNGYYVWKDAAAKIHIAWTMERKAGEFSGWVSTDGKITEYQQISFGQNDKLTLNSEKNRLDFSAPLTDKDLAKEIVFSVSDYSYLEFELKVNNSYDLGRTHVGEYLANPKEAVFKIGNNYFDNLKKVPFYKKHPYSGLFYKLSKDMLFTMGFVFTLGIIIIEIIRITAVRKKILASGNKRYNYYLFLCYGVLILIGAGIYLFLTRLSFI
jgi:hypothetical protein